MQFIDDCNSEELAYISEDLENTIQRILCHMCGDSSHGASLTEIIALGDMEEPRMARKFEREVFDEGRHPVRLTYCHVISLAAIRVLISHGSLLADGDRLYLKEELRRRIPRGKGEKVFLMHYAMACLTDNIGELETMRTKIDCLYLGKKLFFKPWIGTDYLEGVAGKRILILGASGYCVNSQSCSMAEECRNPKNGYMSYWNLDKDCIQGKGSLEGFSLSTFNERVICEYLRERESWNSGNAEPETYRRFDEKMLEGYLPFYSSREIWSHASFFNFLTVLLGNDDRITPGYKLCGEVYNDSYDVMSLLLEVLRPDKVIIWGSKVKQFLKAKGLLDGRCIPIMHPSYRQFGNSQKSNILLEKLREEFGQ